MAKTLVRRHRYPDHLICPCSLQVQGDKQRQRRPAERVVYNWVMSCMSIGVIGLDWPIARFSFISEWRVDWNFPKKVKSRPKNYSIIRSHLPNLERQFLDFVGQTIEVCMYQISTVRCVWSGFRSMNSDRDSDHRATNVRTWNLLSGPGPIL